MNHRRLRRKLGRTSAHRKALLRNLVRGLVKHKRIETTLAKAKEASAFSDKLIQLAKRGDMHARRLLTSKLGCDETAALLMKEIAPHFKERNGGYTRVLRLGIRQSDGSQMALLEFSESIALPESKKPKKAKKKAQKTKEPEAEKADKKPKSAKAEKQPKKEQPSEEAVDKKETDKKGGFLGTLRKFLKGDE